VLHGGGNTSVKTFVNDLLGEPVEALCVKGSGGDMARIEPANMPAVLIEMGYLTNAEQEHLLVSDMFQSTFVQALYDAVVRFRDSTAAAGTR
jgi:rhamnose utilization protein RhaD (predicted bifunctional aldolase and dehydrogenase)